MGSAFDMNTDTKVWMKTMKLIGNDALPDSVSETLNVTADSVTKQQIKNAGQFIIRTPFTLRSMQSSRAKPYKALNKAKGKNIQRMFSRSGTFSTYLWKQENGGTFAGLDGPVPIATDSARTSKNHKKAVAKRFRIKESDPLKDGAFGDTGKQFIGSPRGVVNGKARARGIYVRSGNNKRLTMLRNLESKSIKIKGTKFHAKAVDRKATKALVSTRFRRIAQKKLDKVARRG